MPFSDVIGHEKVKAVLRAALRQDRVAHALLFHGDDGIGKRLMALRFAQAIHCEVEIGADHPDACGTCRSCTQIESGTHPDFLLLEPDREQVNPQIKIEQIRELEQQIIYRPLIGSRKVFLIDDADRLTLGAANALLKTLEEPPGYSVIILVSSRPSALPATVRSRCQSVRCSAPTRDQVEAVLRTKRGLSPQDARYLAIATEAQIGHALIADLKAMRTQQDEYHTLVSLRSLSSFATILAAAEALHKSDRGPEALEWVAQWIRDLILVCVGGDREALVNGDRLSSLEEASRTARLDLLLDLHEDLGAMSRAASRNLNLQLALENTLLRLREALCMATESRTAT